MRPLVSSALCLALALPAAANTVSVEVNGVVAGSSISSGPFAGMGSGTPVKVSFNVTTPGNPIQPGQFEAFTIVPASFELDIGGATLGLNSAPSFGIMDDYPVADGAFLFMTALQSSHWMEIELHDSSGTVFDSTNLALLAGTYPGSSFDTADWSVLFGAGSAGIALTSLVVHPESGGPIGTSYCTSVAGASGVPAKISATGSASVAANELELHAVGLPVSQNGVFLYGPNAIQTPFAGGFLCVGGGIQRLLPPINSGAAGALHRVLDLSAPPASSGPFAILPGSTWRFQAWFRDPATVSNLTDGLAIAFIH
jgi:hypothetical protein